MSWLLFTWMIARLPRESVSFRSSVRAGLIAAVAFEIFKLVASVYLKSVVTGPAGATFGPVLGLMVFAYITARLILFSTAWAATTPENMGEDPDSRAGARGDQQPDHHPAGAGPAAGGGRGRGGSAWRAELFATQAPSHSGAQGQRTGRRFIARATMIRQNTTMLPITPRRRAPVMR